MLIRGWASSVLGTKILSDAYPTVMKTSHKLAFLSVLLLSTLTLAAQSKPNLTGSWELNPEKSDLGGAPLSKLTVQVDHKDPVLKYTATGNAGGEDFSESEAISTDGKPTKDSRGATVTAHWDGKALVIETTSPDGATSDVSRLAVSPDGKTMTRDYDRKGAEGPQKRHEIYEKK